MVKLRTREKCYIYLWLSVFIYFLAVSVFSNQLFRFAVLIPAMLVLFVVGISKISMWEMKDLLSLISILFILCVGFVYGHVVSSFVHWKTTLFFVTQLCAIVLCSKGRVTKKTFDWIFFFAILIAITFAIISFFPLVHKVTTDERVYYTIYYAFNLSNSNLAGMFLLCIFMVLLINLKFRKHKYMLSALIAFVGYMLYKTNARSCILAGIVILFFYFFFKKKIPRFIIWSCMAIPLAFPVIYNWLLSSFDENFVFLGKTFFSGREHVFEAYLSKMDTWLHYLVGNFGEFSFQNAHNGPLAVYAATGVIGVLLTYGFYWRAIIRINSNETGISTLCVACLLGIFIQSSAEAAVLLGSFPLVVFISTIFLLANYKEPICTTNVVEVQK